MKINVLIAAVSLVFATSMSAQKTVNEDEQLWLAVFNQTRFTDRWGAWADLHLRFREGFVGEAGLGIGRVGLTYYLTDDVRLTGAYAYIHHFPADGHQNIARPEHRPWQQVQWFTRWPKVRLMQWIRLEERFLRKTLNDNELGDGYHFNWRTRFSAALFVPLTKKGFAPGGWQFVLNDELFVNFGDKIVYNHFDQNRLFGGLVYQATAHSQLQFGYMNVYQQLAAGNTFRNLHTARIFYFHNLDLRKG